MRNIWTVFKTDIRTLSKCFFACVVVVAIALLPSLYAWLNIYSNWDPYGNTGGISIAVASLDEGYTDEDGTYENKGDDVVADLREATSINWVIVDTEEEAKGGVESGDYYAAVVIDKQFSRNMYRMLTDWTGKPAITYYENAKKNAVATKITDTAVETLKRSISENYLEVVIDGIMEQSNLLAADLTADDPEAAVKGVLYQAQDLLHACGRMMDAFEAAGGSGVRRVPRGMDGPHSVRFGRHAVAGQQLWRQRVIQLGHIFQRQLGAAGQAGGGQPFGASVNRQQGRRSNLGFGAHKRVQDFPPGHHAANTALEIIFGSRFQLFRRIGRVEPGKRQHSRIVPCQHMGEHPPAFNAPVRVPLQHRCLYAAVHIKRR